MENTELWFLSYENFQLLKTNANFQKDIENVIKYIKSPSKPTPNSFRKPPSFGKQISSFLRSLRLQTTIDYNNSIKGEVSKFLSVRSDRVLKVLNVFIILCSFYQFFIIPYRIGFPYDIHKNWWRLLPDYICDLVFLTNVLLSYYCISQVKKSTNTIHQCKTSSSYYIHLAAVLPTDFLYFALCRVVPLSSLQLLSFLRINRLLYIYDLWCLSRQYLGMFSKRRAILKLAESVLLMLCCAHICGCGFMLIARIENYFGSDCWAAHSGILFNEAHDARVSEYIVALYWAITVLTTVGYGDIVPVTNVEKIYNIVLFVIGTIIFALIFGSFQALITENNYILDRHQETVRKLKKFFKRESIENESDEIKIDSIKSIRRKNILSSFTSDKNELLPAGIWQRAVQSNILQYHRKLWKRNMGESNVDIRKMFSPFNSSSHKTDYTYLIKKLIKADLEKLLLFSSKSKNLFSSPTFRCALYNLFTFQYYSPNQIIFYKGEIADKLYFVVEGEICLTNDQDRLSRGSICYSATNINSPLPTTRSTDSVEIDYLSQQTKTSPSIEKCISLSPRLPKERFTNATIHNSNKFPRRFSVGNSVHQNRPSSKRKAIHYRSVQAGVVTEGEFFLRDTYSCHAQAVGNCSVLEINYTDFILCLKEHGMLVEFHNAIKINALQLRRRSTNILVNNVDVNAHNPKMKHMMSVTLPAGHLLHFPDNNPTVVTTWSSVGIFWRKWTSNHPHLIAWNNWLFLLLTLLVIEIPVLIAFPHCQSLRIVSVVTDVIWTTSIVFDLYLNMFRIECEDSLIDNLFTNPSYTNFSNRESDELLTIEDVSSRIEKYILKLKQNQIWIIVELLACVSVLLSCIEHPIVHIIYSFLRLLYAVHVYKFSDLSACFLYFFSFRMTFYVGHILSCVVVLLYAVHVIACGWILLGHVENDYLNLNSSWIVENSIFGNFTEYYTAFYWSMYTITTVGYGSVSVTTTAERIYAATVMIMGAIFTAYYSAILGSAVNYYFVHQNNSAILVKDGIKHYVKQRTEVPPSFHDKLNNYLEYVHNKLDKMDDFENFKLIPPSLKRDWMLSFATELFSYQLLHEKRIHQVNKYPYFVSSL